MLRAARDVVGDRRRGRQAWLSLVLAAVVLGPAPASRAASNDPRIRGSRAPIDDAALDRLRALHHTEQAQVRLVLLPATVTDRRGRMVRGLAADDFRLFEDHIPQPIEVFSSTTAEPISIAFLLDLSGSMRQLGKLDEAKEAIRVFVGSLNPGDRVALIGFADDRVDWITDFTADRERFLARLDVQEAYGQTGLYDAVAATPRLVDERIKGRKAIVLITDGMDNASRMNTFKALQLAREVSVAIYTIGFSSLPRKLVPRGGTQPVLQVLELFSAETGGALFSVHDPDDLKETVAQISEELRSQYMIGYYPSRRLWDGAFRRVKLEPIRRGLEVRTRRGYYAVP